MAINHKSFHKNLILIYFKLLLVSLIIVLFNVFFLSFLLSNEILLPANYYERLVNEKLNVSKSGKVITSQDIPAGLSYGFFSTNGDYIDGNLNNADIKYSKKAIEYKYNFVQGNTVYRPINNFENICVVKYDLLVSFKNTILKKIFPYPELELFILSSLILLFFIYFITRNFSNKVKSELKKFNFVADKIRDQDLEFTVPIGYYKEFQDVLSTLDCLIHALNKSLVNQLEEEKNKQEQISSLAHDIKIPLTVIKGNTELMDLNPKYEVENEYTAEILEATAQIEEYINLLIMASSENGLFKINLQNINFYNYFDVLLNQICKLVESQGGIAIVDIKLDNNIMALIDNKFLTRAIINIVMNAIEHTKDTVKLTVENNAKFIIISIVDNGNGFSEEVLAKAKTLFFMEDRSRVSNNHYGIGLYFAQKIIASHDGFLFLENDKCGGKVQIHIPVNMLL